MEAVAALIAATLSAGTPLLLAAVGLLLNERAGVLNLGAEGMMLVAAAVGFAAGFHSGSVTVALMAGAAAGVTVSMVFSLLAVGMVTNQYATGLALTLFGAGLSAFIGLPYVGKTLLQPGSGSTWSGIPWLKDIPFAGPAFFSLHPVVYLALLLTGAVAWFLTRTRAGLVVQAVGESPESAHAVGLPVRGIRIAAVSFGGACCGLAGAYLSCVYTPLWVDGMVAGRGWIALALTTFATWRPWRVALGAYLFGSVTMIQFYLQAEGVQIASQLLSMLPYLATVVVLAVISRNPVFIRLNMPASLGKPFRGG
ncbi:MAG TPA: ABC transporter permease [Lautropia sp.]|jgi:simple sugar transport system permease protein|nr:ABC transporter permease [Lautropia sp.]